MHYGKWAIALMFFLALAGSVFAIWYRYQQEHRAIAFWGSEGALLIKHAPQVFLARLARNAAEPAETTVLLDEADWLATDSREITAAKGLIHARHALLQDASFAWDKPPPPSPVDWEFLLRFVDGPREFSVAYDADHGWLVIPGTSRRAALGPVQKALKALLNRQYEPQTGQP